MSTIYRLKPRFQASLRPMVRRLARIGVTANSVTLTALSLSVALGAALFCFGPERPALFFLLPLWMFLRMALNAADGMLAREFDQRSPLGAYLNELADVVSDAALTVPFALIAPFGWASVASVIFLATVSEMAGALGPMIGAARQYDGPMGKSDRAALFGGLGLWVAAAGTLPDMVFWLLPAAAAAIAFNTVQRVRSGLREVSRP